LKIIFGEFDQEIRIAVGSNCGVSLKIFNQRFVVKLVQLWN